MDNLLLVVFGVLSTLALAFGILSFALAVRYAKKKEGELKMVAWAVAGLTGFVFAGMSWAYFLIPILLHRLFR